MMTITMTPAQTEMYLSSIKVARRIVIAEIKAEIRRLGVHAGQAVTILTANGYEAWRDVG